MTLRWTMEKPTKEGFYWVREPHQPHMPHPLALGRPRIVEICGEEVDELRLYDAGVDMAEPVTSCRVVWWYGPLEAPPDPPRRQTKSAQMAAEEGIALPDFVPPVPVEDCELSVRALVALEKLGVQNLSQLSGRPTAELLRSTGKKVLREIEQAFSEHMGLGGAKPWRSRP
jgi:hypothetical protein